MRWLWMVLGVVGVAAVAIAFLPLRWVTERYVPGLEAESITGSIWDARLREASFQGVPLGNIDAGLQLAPLLRGEAEISFRKLDKPLQGRLVGARGSSGFEGLSGDIELPVLPPPLPPLVLTVDNASLRASREGRCVEAGGRVATSLAHIPNVGTVPLLAGEARCDNDAVMVPLRGEDGKLGLDVRVAAGGQWQATLRLTTTSALSAATLALAGFNRDGADMLWTVSGTPAGVTDYGMPGGVEVLGRALAAAVGVVPRAGVDGPSNAMPSPPGAAGE